jgi:chromosome segregation ATPase
MHSELSVELQNSKSSAQDWERWHGELSVELQTSKSSVQDWEQRYSELSVELQASSASIRSLTYQAAYADATFRDLREEDAHDLTLLHFHNSIVERHTKEIGRLGLELRANRQCLDPLFTQLAECHQAAMEGKHKTFAMTRDASFVKAMGVFKAGLKALQNDLVGALRQKNQLLSRLNTALGEAVQASSINGMAEQNAQGDLETRLKAVLAHSEAIYAALGAENEREVNLHLTTLQEMHSFINPEQPWENIEMNCSRDEYAAQVTARVEALKERVYDVGDMVHELQKQEGRRIWANNALLLYNRVVTLESEMKELQEIMEEKDRIAWGLNAQVQQVRGFLVTLGVLEEEDGGDGEEDGGDGGNGGDEEEEEEDPMEVA